MATKKKTATKKTIQKPARPVKQAAKKPAPKKTAKKPAPKKAIQKPASKKTVKKPVAKKAIQKPAPRKSVKKSAPQKVRAPVKAKKVVARKPVLAEPAASKGKSPRTFRKEELAFFRTHLQQHLELIQGNLNALAGDNLKRSAIETTGDIRAHSTHMADHGTDNFDRELALNLASSRQDSVYDIEDAIRRIDDGTYGACETCGCAIERPRLRALPFAKKCVACQNAAERGRTKYRPFGGTLPLQQMAAEDAAESPDSMG